MRSHDAQRIRSYWVVSPNVDRRDSTVNEWCQFSQERHAAFMGYPPHGKGAGSRFAKQINARDVILIARRHEKKPQIVGFGVVRDEKYKRRVKGVRAPYLFDSARVLEAFVTPGLRLLTSIPFLSVLRHTKALVRLYPERNASHRRVCEWMWQRILGKSGNRLQAYPWLKTESFDGTKFEGTRDTAFRPNKQLDYTYRTREEIKQARRSEQGLMNQYENWLLSKGRSLVTARYQGNLVCDAIEKKRRNLIEAKSSNARERVRMAVGQLLDYEFQGGAKRNKAILVPKRPGADIEKWLQSLKIWLIWPQKGGFHDNKDGQFT